MIYLTCYHILQAKQKSKQAASVLALAWQHLTSQAAQIKDPILRQSYLTNIPENQEIQALAKQ